MRRSSARIRPRCDGPARRSGKGPMPRSSKDACWRLRQELRAARRAAVFASPWQQRESSREEHTRYPSRSFTYRRRASEGLMRLPQVILAAAISLGCAAAEAAASPLIPMPSVAFPHANSGIDTVRWRYRHSRPFFWSGRGDTVGRGDADAAFSSSSAARSLNSAVPPAGSEIFRLDPPRRRGWVDPPPPR